MYYNIGDKVIFLGPNRKNKWKLDINRIYTIYDRLEHLGVPLDEQKLYYAVLDSDGIVTNWFEYDEFMPIKKYRKEKLICIDKNTVQ